MLNIKFSTESSEWPILQQTPGSSGIWNDCHFFLKDIDSADYWVVYDSIKNIEKIQCIKGNTILITGEPPSVKIYDQAFLNQFDYVITSHQNISHKNKILYQQALPWHVGRRQKNHVNISFSKSYDELIKIKTIKKEKKISVIISDKSHTLGHIKRIEFVKKLKEIFKDKFDVFGRGFNEIEDKWDAIGQYEYHLVLENSSYPDYWTEKLADAYLALSFPVYYGCTNIIEYFSNESMAIIDIDDFDKSVKIIDELLNSNTYTNNFNKILEARQLVLNKYNLFPMLSDFCESRKQTNNKYIVKTIKPELYFQNSLIRRIKNKIKRLTGK